MATSKADDLYDAKVTVLGEQVAHHVKEEEGDLFAQARKAKVDTAAFGAKMFKRKPALMAAMGIVEEAEPAEESARAVRKANNRR